VKVFVKSMRGQIKSCDSACRVRGSVGLLIEAVRVLVEASRVLLEAMKVFVEARRVLERAGTGRECDCRGRESA
jgi:hypothetical protein